MSVPVGLTPEDFERMALAVRRAEGLPPRRDGQLVRHGVGTDAPHNWIVITSATGQPVTLANGNKVTGYPAVWSYFDSSGPGFVDTLYVCWFVGANGETPAQGTRYECRAIGQDADGVPIWSEQIYVPSPPPPPPPPCPPAAVGPFLVGLTCSNDNLIPTWGYLCGAGTCDLYLSSDTCGLSSPPAPPPCPPSTSAGTDFGNVWGQ